MGDSRVNSASPVGLCIRWIRDHASQRRLVVLLIRMTITFYLVGVVIVEAIAIVVLVSALLDARSRRESPSLS